MTNGRLNFYGSDELLIETIALSIIMPIDKLRKDLLEVYIDGAYDIKGFEHKYKIPLSKIENHLKILEFIY